MKTPWLASLLIAISTPTMVIYGQEKLQKKAHPNIIIFLVDDMGLMDTSVPFITDGKGHPIVQPLNTWFCTPQMNRLAKQGIRFSHFYACTVSSPSRCSLLTGQNSARHHTTQWIQPDANNKGKYGPSGWNWKGLNDSIPTLPKLLHKAGYRTIHVGKAHFGPKDSAGANPLKLGFDVNIGGCHAGRPASYYGQMNYGGLTQDKLRAIPGLDKYHGKEIFLTEALTLEAKNEIGKSVDRKQPFFLYLSHYAVHSPFQADPRFVKKYEGKGKTKMQIGFSALIEGMDKSLGDLLDYLEKRGIAENTLILFVGDNGSDSPMGTKDAIGSSAPLRGKKGTHWEGGTRVPFIAAWAHPNQKNPWQRELPIPRNKIQEQMGCLYDLYPTLLTFLGLSSPEKQVLDGIDLSLQLKGERNENREEIYLSHFPHPHHNSYFTTYRHDCWKIAYFYNPAGEFKGQQIYLYHLEKDPSESKDVASSYPQVVHRLFKEMQLSLKEMGAQYPEVENKELLPTEPK